MSQYTERTLCPVCGAKSFVTITAHGDYDGPDGPRETNPCECPTCLGIKMANPAMHERLMALWEQIKAERKRCAERIERIESSRYSEHELYSRFHEPYLDKTLAKLYAKEIRSLTKCTDSKDPEDEWVRSRAAKTFAFRVIDIAVGKTKVSPTYR